MTCGIYKITRKDTGQMYVGLSEDIENRYHQHANGNNIKSSRIDRAMVKYRADKFDLEIIEELPNDRALLMEREAYWVAHYNTYEDDFHYNLTPGGDFSPMKIPEIAAKISGENNPMKNPEVAAKVSKANSGENHPLFGRKHSQETKEKISKALSGRKCSREAKARMSKAHLGKKLSDEQKISISKTTNTSGYYRVLKNKNKKLKQGFTWAYNYYEDGKRKSIYSVDIKKLEEKVRAKGLKWLKFD